MADLISSEIVKPGVALLTLQRPERRNALSIALLKQMMQRMEEYASHSDRENGIRVVILRGAGPVFCAGLDLAEATQAELVAESARCVAGALATMRYSPLVTIAAVHGGAYAGGAGLMAACDVAVGANDVQIGFPEARRGLLPALISEVMKAKVREGDLRELFLVGNLINAQRAQQIGLLQRVVDNSALMSEAMNMADGILAGGPQTIVDTKLLIEHLYEPDRKEHCGSQEESAIEEHLRARQSAEAVEGLRAFLEKRPPSWVKMSQ